MGPVRLRKRQPCGAAAILHRRIEGDVGDDRAVVACHLVEEGRRIDTLQLLRQVLERVRRHLRHVADAILVAEQGRHLAVEDLPGELAGLVEDDAAVLGIRSEEHTSELQSLMRISYAVFCLKKKKQKNTLKSHIIIVEASIYLSKRNKQLGRS